METEEWVAGRSAGGGKPGSTSKAARPDRARFLGASLRDRPAGPASGISKAELGRRRVDVDDLVALAVLLNVTPNRLLPADADDKAIKLAPGGASSAWNAWA